MLWSGVNNPTDTQLDVFKPYVTRWGADPLWSATAQLPGPLPNQSHFPSQIAAEAPSAPGVRLAEIHGSVGVAPHEVLFDAKRGLWFCDIEVATGTYMPFIRLALARFQPKSHAGVELSPVTLADFMQLAPDRTATVARTGNHLNVSVSGPGYTQSAHGKAPSTVVVSLEQQRADVRDDVLGWAPVVRNKKAVEVTLTPTGSTWHGTVAIPTGITGNLRIVIREFEEYDKPPTSSGQTETQRLTYLDVIPL